MLVAVWPNNFQTLLKEENHETRNAQIHSGTVPCPSDCALPGVSSSTGADRSISGPIRQHAPGAPAERHRWVGQYEAGDDDGNGQHAEDAVSGDIDKDFAMMMKMHHQQAVDMAQMELANGKSPEMKAMAKQIIAAQKKEIARFDRWLAKQK